MIMSLSFSLTFFSSATRRLSLSSAGALPAAWLSSCAGPEPVYNAEQHGYSVWRHALDASSPDLPFRLELGGVLPRLEIAYETWGALSPSRDNAILLHTGLSASSHARSHPRNPLPGWWEDFIGPGLALDTDKFFVVCTNVLGGCYGTTGPSSFYPASDPLLAKRYGCGFPTITVPDMVRAQMLLVRRCLGVERLFASVGSSLGGMQSLALAALFPSAVARLVTVSACARTSPSAIAQRYTQRRILMSDPHWRGGDYYDGPYPHSGMQLARQVATISYRSGPEWNERFARKRVSPAAAPSPLAADFAIEAYLDFQSRKFSAQYDPNSMLYISKAMDLFDLGQVNPISSHNHSDESSNHSDNSNESSNHSNESSNHSNESSNHSNESSNHSNESSNHSNESSNHSDNSNESSSHSKEDLPVDHSDLRVGLSRVQADTLVIGVQSDTLFPCWQQQEIATHLRAAGVPVTYYELDSIYGHDTFLIDIRNVGAAIKGHLEHRTIPRAQKQNGLVS